MSLAAMLAAHDEAALEALASKGLLRRARRDLDAGLARVLARDEAAATVEADGEQVAIGADGVAAARCGCPASGVCRHVLLAVLALRASDADASDTPDAADASGLSSFTEGSRASSAPDASGASSASSASGKSGESREPGEPGEPGESDTPSTAKVSDASGMSGATDDAGSATTPSSGALREKVGSTSTSPLDASRGKPRTSPVRSAREELVALPIERLRKFAGADWTNALALASADERSTVTDDGASCRVAIDDGLATITFIAGQGLKGAVCKGPVTKTRLLKSAAALLVRRRAGVADVGESSEDAGATALEPGFVDGARAALLEATALTLSSASPLAADLLFDLAISARAETAPRVSATLRGLARQAALAPSRHVDFDAEEFLGEAARAYALLEAIRRSPDDPVLLGTLRRDYADAPPLELLMLGARIWSSDVGARGVTAWGYSTAEGRWYSMTRARGAGMDPTFSPRDAYRAPLWGASAMAAMIGRRVRLPRPRVDADGALADNVPEAATVAPRATPFADLRGDALVHADWQALLDDVASRLGTGLRRSARSVPALVAPAGFGAFGFDALRQVYDWEALDEHGRVLRVALAGDAHALALKLRAIAPRIRLLLLEARSEARETSFRPVSVVFDDGGALDVRVVDTDDLPTPGRLERMRSTLDELFAARRTTESARATGVDRLLDSAASAALDLASRAPKPDLAALAADADTLGLTTLASAARRADADPGTRAAIRLAYVAGELRDAARSGS